MDENKLTGTAATQAKRKYNEKAYDRLYPMVKKGKKEKYIEAAKVANLTLNQFMEKAMDKAAGIIE